MTLTHRTYSAARWTTASSISRVVLQLLQIAILARLLAPTDYGLMAMVTVVLSYAGLFSDMGLSTAFVQRQQINHEERSSLYWLSVAVGGALMLIVMGISPLVAMFFKEPQLIPLMMLIATNFLVIAFGQQLRMDAEKSLNFRPVAIIEIMSALVGLGVATVTIWLEWRVYALVAAAMASAWFTMIMSWLLLAQGWRPTLRLNWNDVRWFLRFGGSMVLNNLINHINTTIDLILGGHMLGASQLGLYSIPRNLILQVQFMVNPIFTRVGFPLIASIQHDNKQVKQVYLKTMNMTASVNTPIYLSIAFFAPEIIRLLLGPEWTESTPLMRVLALWGLLRSFSNPVGSLLFGLGYVRLSVQWNAALLLIFPPAVWLGSQWGAVGMAWAMAGLTTVLFVPGWAILIRPTCGAGLGEYFSQLAIPTFCAGVAVVLGWLSVWSLDGAMIRLALGLSLSALTYLTMSRFFNREFCAVIAKSLGKK